MNVGNDKRFNAGKKTRHNISLEETVECGRIRRLVVAFEKSAVPAGLVCPFQSPALKRRAIVGRRFAAHCKTWGGLTFVPSEQVGLSPTFLME